MGNSALKALGQGIQTVGGGMGRIQKEDIDEARQKAMYLQQENMIRLSSQLAGERDVSQSALQLDRFKQEKTFGKGLETGGMVNGREITRSEIAKLPPEEQAKVQSVDDYKLNLGLRAAKQGALQQRGLTKQFEFEDFSEAMIGSVRASNPDLSDNAIKQRVKDLHSAFTKSKYAKAPLSDTLKLSVLQEAMKATQDVENPNERMAQTKNFADQFTKLLTAGTNITTSAGAALPDQVWLNRTKVLAELAKVDSPETLLQFQEEALRKFSNNPSEVSYINALVKDYKRSLKKKTKKVAPQQQAPKPTVLSGQPDMSGYIPPLGYNPVSKGVYEVMMGVLNSAGTMAGKTGRAIVGSTNTN